MDSQPLPTPQPRPKFVTTNDDLAKALVVCGFLPELTVNVDGQYFASFEDVKCERSGLVGKHPYPLRAAVYLLSKIPDLHSEIMGLAEVQGMPCGFQKQGRVAAAADRESAR